MLLRSLVAAAAIAAALAGSAGAQDTAARLTAAARAEVYELLSYDCGVAEVEDRFRQAVARIGPVAEPLFVVALAQGAPDEVRAEVRQQAEARHARRQQWLAENGEALFGDDAKRIAARDRAAFVADALQRLDALYRENAVRGLGIVGGPSATALIERAAARDPDLAILAERALQEIRQRR